MDKQALGERDSCTQFNTPAMEAAGWNVQLGACEQFLPAALRATSRGAV